MDFYNYRFVNWQWRGTANFCIKALCNAWTPTNPDLQCDDSISLTEIRPGSRAAGSFTVKNVGEPLSSLDWEITKWPEWGSWTFTPSSGDDLTPEDGDFTIDVDVIAPSDKETEFNGMITIENFENPADTCEIPVHIVTSRSKTLPNTLFMRVFEKFPNAFPVLRYILGL